MAHFLCHLGAHILEPFCSISILPKTPHEIEYTLTFLQDTIKQDTSFEMMAMVAGTVIVIAIVVIISFLGIHKKRRSK